MKKTNVALNSMSSRVIDDITFQASLLALHAAIAFADTAPRNPLEGFGAGPDSDGPLHSLMELARRPAKGTEPLKRRDPRGI